MVIYKQENRFDHKTGKPAGSSWVFAGVLCDFTGEYFDYPETCGGPSYEINYESIDPCFGDGEGEYELCKKYGMDAHAVFSSPYHFKADWDAGEDEVTKLLVEAAREEGYDWPSIDSLFRWSRVRMLTNILEEKKYTIQELVKY